VRVLLDRGADGTIRDPFHGFTPLMVAVGRGNAELIKCLISEVGYLFMLRRRGMRRQW
jgi:hypothetical protein